MSFVYWVKNYEKAYVEKIIITESIWRFQLPMITKHLPLVSPPAFPLAVVPSVIFWGLSVLHALSMLSKKRSSWSLRHPNHPISGWLQRAITAPFRWCLINKYDTNKLDFKKLITFHWMFERRLATTKMSVSKHNQSSTNRFLFSKP